MAKFKVTWQASDGYVGKSRPQSFEINSDDFEAEDDPQYLEELFYERLGDDFRQKVQADPDNYDEFLDNYDEFLEWALAEQAKKAAE